MSHKISPAFAKTCLVRSYDIGSASTLTVPAALRYLHDVAQDHASAYKFGYSDLQDRGLAWALVALDLSFRKTIPGGAGFQVETSVAQYGGPIVYRDYVARFGESLCIVGQSMWVLIDLDTRKGANVPADLRQQLGEIVYPLQVEVSRVRRLKPLPDPVAQTIYKVGYHDCDFNGHLNNVVSVRWMLDELYRLAPSLIDSESRLRLTYLNEILVDQSCYVYATYSAGTGEATLIREDGEVAVILEFSMIS